MTHCILVTGGAGFIGSHLCRRLLSEGNRVICLDNLYTGAMENIADLMENPDFRFTELDVTEPFSFDVDQIYNLACPASPEHYQRDPIKTAMTNVLGAVHCLELACRQKATVLLSSTSEVYGEPLVHPQAEDYRGNVNPIGIRSCYDEGKRMAETLFFDYHRQRGADIRVVRIFNTYGPQMLLNDGRVVSNLITQALSGRDLTIYGDGLQTRSFCYVSDTVDALIRMVNTPDITGPVNVGNPQEMTVLEIAQMILKETGSPSKLVFCPLPQDDPSRRKPDITRAKTLLGWQPNVMLEEGLKQTVADFRLRMGTGE
ncbi:MAG: SDR family oxidoreductase [Oscillospiraceae bacterium]|nr:SDR family oxidoreductase [Oscillospiraceae bacterium]